MLYACCSLARIGSPKDSSAGLGLAGVALVVGSVASGLGLCALLGLPFTAATTQVLPFLAMGLGVDDMFLVVSTVGEVDRAFKTPLKGVAVSRPPSGRALCLEATFSAFWGGFFLIKRAGIGR